EHPNFQYLILPINSLKGQVSFTNKTNQTFTIDSDYYFANLDDDFQYIPEIYVSRASLLELLNISTRKNLSSLKSLIALPIIQYSHWLGCSGGGCYAT
ncbi:MAG TPA: hypothetical protein PLH82_01530, partial [Candidatus Paceibacterota bacterium]|nr:hypothetical protein [Candidatus Paceibacterota bacterium]